MPIPQTKCCICNETVNKSQTYHIGNGKRACKKHEGVLDKAANAQQKIKDDQKKKLEEEERRRKQRFKSEPVESTNEMIEGQLWAWFTCWCCGKPGIQLQDYYHKIMVAMRRLELKDERLDFFNMPQQLQQEIGWKESGLTVLNRLELPAKPNRLINEVTRTRKRVFKAKLKYERYCDMRTVLGFCGFVQVCPDCAKNHNLEFWPKPIEIKNLEAMLMLGQIYEESDLAKTHDAIARVELALEGQDVDIEPALAHISRDS